MAIKLNNKFSNFINKNKPKNIPKFEISDNNTNLGQLPISQRILILYNFVFLSIISFMVIVDWDSIWQLPKASIFIFGVSVFLFIASILWIFGFIKHTVSLNLGDIILFILGLAILIITLFHPDTTAFAFLRGGGWFNSSITNTATVSGVFTLILNDTPSSPYYTAFVGFRCVLR